MKTGAGKTRRRALDLGQLFLWSLVSGLWSVLPAQSWNSPRALDLARRAIERRTNQIAASRLASYRAEAKGYLSFLAQVGDTAWFSPRLIKQTQLAVDVYWQAPASSKQIVKGMRDTQLTPADIGYYSDRFGIVQSNFPDLIRLGDGRDVSDVPHPLGPSGLSEYDFALVDSLSITTLERRIDVFKLAYRPRNARAPRAAGAAYVDVQGGDIVALELAFTRAAILDPRIEHLSVVLENNLIEGLFWLPRRQTLEVVRTGTKFLVEVRGIIRGRWDVCCYDVEFTPPPRLFTGPPISFAPREQLRAYKFEGGVLDSLPPDVAILRPDDVKRAQEQVEQLVSREFRERSQRAALSMPRLTDIARINRAEGVAVGAAARARMPGAAPITLDIRARFGFADEEWKGEAGLGVSLPRGTGARLFVSREYADVRDAMETSGIRNSIAAQEFGSDYTDPYDVRAYGVQLTLGRWAGVHWRLDAAHEQHESLTVRATPETGAYESLIPARSVSGHRLSLRAAGARWRAAGGVLTLSSELRFADYDTKVARIAVDAEYSHALGSTTVVSRTVGAAISGGDIAPQLGVFFGGPTTAPGYAFDDFGARRGVSQRLEWRVDMPFVPMTLGRFGRVPARATFAPFAHVVWVDDALSVAGPLAPEPMPPAPTPPIYYRGNRQGWYPAVGFAIEPLLGMVRIEVARGLREGRWTFSADLARHLWPIL